MNDDREIAEEPEAPGNLLGKPEDRLRKEAAQSRTRRNPRREISGPRYTCRSSELIRPRCECSAATPSTIPCPLRFRAFDPPKSDTSRRSPQRKASRPMDAARGRSSRRPARQRSKRATATRTPDRSAEDTRRITAESQCIRRSTNVYRRIRPFGRRRASSFIALHLVQAASGVSSTSSVLVP